MDAQARGITLYSKSLPEHDIAEHVMVELLWDKTPKTVTWFWCESAASAQGLVWRLIKYDTL